MSMLIERNDQPPLQRASRTVRWAAWPFMILMLSSGLPLNYKLEPVRTLGVADAAEMTAAATSSENFANSILFVIFLGGLYCLAAWILFRKPRIVASMMSRQWPLFLLLLFVAMSILWTYNPAKVATNIVHNIGTASIAIAAVVRYRHDPWLFPKHLGYVLGINMLFHIAGIILIPSYTIDWQERWHGLTTHPNTLGAMAFTTLWANAAVLLCTKQDKYHLHMIFAALGAIAMIGADSVTSMMVSICAVASIITLNKLEKLGVGREFYISVVTIISLTGLIILLVGATFDFSGLFGLFGRDADLTGRTSLWADAITAIIEHPLLGWSFDDHAHLITAAGMAYPSYHNGFLDLAVSGGIIAIALLFMMLGKLAVEFASPSRIAKQIAPYSASFVIAYLLHNMTEASLVSPRGQMWGIFLVLAFLGACKKWPVQKNWQPEPDTHPVKMPYAPHARYKY